MSLTIQLSISDDGRLCRLRTPDQEAQLTARDLEEVILILGDQRASMAPPVTLLSPASPDHPEVDAMSPDVAVSVVLTPPSAMVCVAFPTLGVRSFSLSRDELLNLQHQISSALQQMPPERGGMH